MKSDLELPLWRKVLRRLVHPQARHWVREAGRRVARVYIKLMPLAFIAEGPEAGTGEPLRVLYIGRDQVYRTYLFDHFFAREPAVRNLFPAGAPRLLVGLLSRLRCGQPDLRICEKEHAHIFMRGWRVPRFVESFMDLPEKPEELRPKKQYKNSRRDIRRNGFTCSISRELEDFRFFYDRMYAPFVRKHYGGEGYLKSWHYIRLLARQGAELLFVEEPDGRRVAAQLIQYDIPGTALLGCMGYLDGELEMRNRTNAAMDYFSLSHLIGKGYRRASIGLSKPFLNDGVFRYKLLRSWKTGELLYHSPEYFIIRFFRVSHAVESLLRNNPVIFRDSADRYSIVLTARAGDDPERILDTCRAIEGVCERLILAPSSETGAVREMFVASGLKVLPCGAELNVLPLEDLISKKNPHFHR